ncbi:T9SS type A sorting domain-containing protein [bacterium]|nr:T9SS type A sorting domain-containing protein [bacterium]
MKKLMWAIVAIALNLSGSIYAQCMDSIWVIEPGSQNLDFGTGITLAENGDAVMCGYYDYTGITQGLGWLIRVNPASGATAWSRTFSYNGGQSIFHDVFRTNDNGYVCAGWMRMPETNQQYYWLHRVNSNGDSLWSRIYGNNTLPFQGTCVVQSPDGGYGIAGRAHSLPGGFGGHDWLLIKTDQNGDSVWSVLIGEPDEDTCREMILTAEGNFLLMGYFSTELTRNGRLAEVSQAGEVLWSRSYTQAVSVRFESAVLLPDGGFMVCGVAQHEDSDIDVLILRVDAEGNELWHRTHDLLPEDDDVSTSIVSDGQEGFYVFGHGSGTSATEKNVFTLHVSGCGDIAEVKWLGGPSDEEIWDGVLTPGGMLVTTGVVRLSPTQTELLCQGISADTCNIPPCSFARLSPQDSSVLEFSYPLTFTWNRSMDYDGDNISYIFHVESTYGGGINPADTITSDTTVNVTIDIPVSPLDNVYDFHWTVRATDGIDTVDALNDEGYFRMDIPESADEVILHPSSFFLSAFPNPFNATTTFSFTLLREEQVSLALFDLQGRLVKTLVNERMTSGVHAMQFNGNDLASGIYFAQLRTATQSNVAKVILLK